MAAKKHKKNPLAESGSTAGHPPPPAKASPSNSNHDRVATTIYGAFFLFLFLACSPALDSKFSLPKLIVLSAGVLALSLLLIVRISRSHSVAPINLAFLPALALGVWWVLSTPFALHLPTALNGEYDYYNGLWTHLCWLSLFVVSMLIPSDTLIVRKIVFLLVAAIVPVAAINILETTGLTTMGLSEVSTLGDRVATGALMNFAIPFAVIALVRTRHWGYKTGLCGMLAMFLVSEFLSQGRGPWLGLIVAVAILITGMSHAKTRIKVISALLAGMIVLGGLTALLNPAVAHRFASLTHATQDEAINQRFIYYRAALRAINEHPVTGIGFENFRNGYPSFRGTDDIYFFNNVIPTMVHNGYLETALNNGIPALIFYLALVATVLFMLGRALRHDEDRDRRDLLLGILAALSAYLVQDMSGWLDMGIASVFWIMLGFAMNQAGIAAPRTRISCAKPLTITLSGLMAILSIYLLNNSYTRFIADSNLFRAQSLDVKTQWRETETLVKSALLALPADSRTEMVAGQIYANRFLASHEPGAYARCHELYISSYDHNRFDRMRLINIIALENAALELGLISASSEFAQKALDVLTETDRDNPGFHELKARFFAAQRQFNKALAAIQEARRLAPQEERFRTSEAEYLRLLSVR